MFYDQREFTQFVIQGNVFFTCNNTRTKLYICVQCNGIMGGGAVDSSRGYVVELDALSTTCSIPTHKLPGDSMQTTLHSLLHCID